MCTKYLLKLFVKLKKPTINALLCKLYILSEDKHEFSLEFFSSSLEINKITHLLHS